MDNFSVLDIFKLEDVNDYYIVDIVKGRVNNNPLIIKTYYIRKGWEDLNISEVKSLCEKYNAKAILYPQLRNNATTARESFGYLADLMVNQDFARGEHLWHDISLKTPKANSQEWYTFEVDENEFDAITDLLSKENPNPYVFYYINEEGRRTIISKPFKIGEFQTKLLINDMHRKLIYKNEPILLYYAN